MTGTLGAPLEEIVCKINVKFVFLNHTGGAALWMVIPVSLCAGPAAAHVRNGYILPTSLLFSQCHNNISTTKVVY